MQSSKIQTHTRKVSLYARSSPCPWQSIKSSPVSTVKILSLLRRSSSTSICFYTVTVKRAVLPILCLPYSENMSLPLSLFFSSARPVFLKTRQRADLPQTSTTCPIVYKFLVTAEQCSWEDIEAACSALQ